METRNETAEKLAKLATEQEMERRRRIEALGPSEARWYIWQCINASDKHALEVFHRFKIETYYPQILELRPIMRRHMSHAQRATGLKVHKPTPCPMFPRYLFTRIDLRRPDWPAMRELAGVGGLMCENNLPVYMPDTAIARIRARESRGPVAGDTTMRVIFEVGETVVVTSGPFASFPGVVEEGLDVPIEKLEPNMRIKVAVSIFGRQTPVTLEHWQVAKQDGDW